MVFWGWDPEKLILLLWGGGEGLRVPGLRIHQTLKIRTEIRCGHAAAPLKPAFTRGHVAIFVLAQMFISCLHMCH